MHCSNQELLNVRNVLFVLNLSSEENAYSNCKSSQVVGLKSFCVSSRFFQNKFFACAGYASEGQFCSVVSRNPLSYRLLSLSTSHNEHSSKFVVLNTLVFTVQPIDLQENLYNFFTVFDFQEFSSDKLLTHLLGFFRFGEFTSQTNFISNCCNAGVVEISLAISITLTHT